MGTQSTTNQRQGSARCSRCRLGLWAGAAILLLAVPSVSAQPALALMLPSAIAYDSQGNLYIADKGASMVRELSATGTIGVVAGTRVQGFGGDGGPATAAELDSPMGLAVDGAGNLYIADSHNQRIREITAATGLITTVAGTGAAGFAGDGGQATLARLSLPTALACDAAGNLYVADTKNHRVRRIAVATGVITTVAGDGVEGFSGDGGPATVAAIDTPSGLAVDGAGNLYIADTHNSRVRKVVAVTGAIATVIGSLGLPRGLSADAAGNIYVADSANQQVLRISGAGVITTVAGDGTQGLAGDGGPAIAASLDEPRSVATSSGGSITIVDAGNDRVRALDASPAPGPDIHTLPWVAGTAVVTVRLTGPSATFYGSGTITAALTASTSVAGSLTFVDMDTGTPLILGSSGLDASGTAAFSTSALAAGVHSIIATYAGDVTYAAAQSSVLTLTVKPVALIATPTSVSIVYGEPIPVLGGILSGVLPQDVAKVAAVFTTTAGPFPAANVYPITATLTGDAAADYVLSAAPASLNVTQAPSSVALSVATANTIAGSPITMSVQAFSTTSGTPSGTITLTDGAVVLGTVQVSASNAVNYSTSSLGLGTHTMMAAYGGDGNFLPSASPSASVVVAAAPGFTFASSDSGAQTVPAGTQAVFHFSVSLQGATLASPILLSVNGQPPGSTAALNPSYLPPGGSVSAFTLAVQTPLAVLTTPAAPGLKRATGSGELLLAVLVLPVFGWSRYSRRTFCADRKFAPLCRIVVIVLFSIQGLSLATGCGNRVNTSSETSQGISYTITVTGTATGPAGAIQHSANVTLEVL